VLTEEGAPPAVRGPAEEVRPDRGIVTREALLVLPALVVMVFLFVLPLAWVLGQSVVSHRHGTPWYSNYEAFFRSPVYPQILLRTAETALVVTVVCLAIGYPFAYLMSSASKRGRGLLLAAVLLPLWSSVLVRTWGWTVLLEDTGVINRILLSLGLVDTPLALMRNTLGVGIGMTQVLLPIMVLPLFASMRRIDPDYVRAAVGLGASPARAFRRVFLPLTRGGVLIGSLLVFVLALGFFITPALLGSPANSMLSEQIVTLLGPARDPGLATAAAGVLLVATIGVLGVAARLLHFTEALGIDRP
jgi:putative spermidine/putrescine transport system permease protein